MSQPLPLDSESDYTFLVEQATKGKNISTVKVTCEQQVGIVVVFATLFAFTFTSDALFRDARLEIRRTLPKKNVARMRPPQTRRRRPAM
jgi:acyl-CoA thioesterase